MKPLLIRLFAVALLCLTANAAFAAEKIRLDYFVICEDAALRAPTEFGKNSTLRISASPKWPESSLFNVPAL
jgi:hypothetical protein